MCELVHCLDETTLSFSPNASVFSWYHHSNAVIRSYNTRRWLFFIFEDNQWKLSHVHPIKLMPWPFQQMELSSPSLELILPFQSIVLTVFCLRCEVIGPCFIHGYESTQKIGFIAVKHHQTLDWNIPWRCFCSIVSKCGTHLVHSFLMFKFSVNMRCTALFEMPTISAS